MQRFWYPTVHLLTQPYEKRPWIQKNCLVCGGRLDSGGNRVFFCDNPARGAWITARHRATDMSVGPLGALVLVLVLIKDHLFIKRTLATWHPYTRASFLCQWL